jgi:hypothetical protein
MNDQENKTGSVMIFAVLLMTAGVFVLAAVVQLAATQGISGDEEWVALERRVTVSNSRALAREYMLSRIFRGPVPANEGASEVSMNNALGGFTIRPTSGEQTNYWAALSTTNTDVVLNINPFNLMERGGFYREVFEGELSQGEDTVDWSFALRTRSPVAAGYSFVQHRPADNPLASYATPPYIDMNEGSSQFYGFEGLPRMPMSSVTNTMTRVAGDTNGYQGYLDVQEGAAVPGLFTNVTFTNRGVGQLQVELDLFAVDPNVANPVLRYDVPSSGQFVDSAGVTNTGPVTKLVLKGSSSEMRKPLHVVVEPTNVNLDTLELTNSNIRRVYFYRARSSNSGVRFFISSINAASWRLGITMSQCDVGFDLGNLEVKGGLRTDGDILFQAGNVNFVPEEDPAGLDFIADRMMWLEDYRAQ